MLLHFRRTILVLVAACTLFATDAAAQSRALSSQDRQIIFSKPANTPFDIITTETESGLKLLQTASPDLLRTDDSVLWQLSRRMFATVTHPDNDGVGIAAPQVGIHTNAMWVQRFDKPDEPFEFYINLKILWRSDLRRRGPEGCLSIPNLRGEVYRPYAISISYETLSGHSVTEIVEGFTAVIFQHEYDHILGILFPKRIEEQQDFDWDQQGQLFILKK